MWNQNCGTRLRPWHARRAYLLLYTYPIPHQCWNVTSRRRRNARRREKGKKSRRGNNNKWNSVRPSVLTVAFTTSRTSTAKLCHSHARCWRLCTYNNIRDMFLKTESKRERKRDRWIDRFINVFSATWSPKAPNKNKKIYTHKANTHKADVKRQLVKHIRIYWTLKY